MDQQQPGNPTILSPASRFAVPSYRSHTSSPSRSPTRRQDFTGHEIDPLLSNLSPTGTLEALRATNAITLAPGSHEKVLSASIADASTSERALAIRAALAGKKLRQWYIEVKDWSWLDTFEELPKLGHREKDGHHEQPSKGHAGSAIDGQTTTTGGTEYWGSLSADVVREREDRIETIRDDMEILDVEELKEHVRSAHLFSRSRSSSLISTDHSDSPPTTYSPLDDFTVVVTATIMQALPYISRLSKVLDVWFVRLVVLRQVPGFLRRLEEARVAVESAWNAVGRSPTSTSQVTPQLTRTDVDTMKSVLQSRVTELGQRLDAMLDTLEGGLDTLPEHWIDSMESIQQSYETWVVDAERQVEENEWRLEQVAAIQSSSQPEEIASFASQDYFSSMPLLADEGDGLAKPSPQPRLVLTDPVTDSMAGNYSDLSFRNVISNEAADPSSESENIVEEYARDYKPEGTVCLQRNGTTSKPEPASSRMTASHRPPPLELPRPTAMTDSTASSDISEPGSATSASFSNMSSPEILDAARVEYFKSPTEERSPFWTARDVSAPVNEISRHSSQRTERSTSTIKERPVPSEGPSPASRSRASSFVPEFTIFENAASPDLQSIENGNIRPELGLKRASVTSIEVLSRSELRNITVRRSGSHSSSSSALPPLNESNSIPVSSLITGISDHLSQHEDHPTVSNSPSLTTSEDQDSSPSVRAIKPRQSQPNPHNHFSGPQVYHQVESDNISSSLIRNQDEKDTYISTKHFAEQRNPSKRILSAAESIEEQLTARITSILTSIPGRIRLAPGPGDTSPEESQPEIPSKPKATDFSKTVSPLERAHSTPAITLAPAFSKTKSRVQSHDTDIKLYYLYQPGKDTPIKLYVRLIGEAGERVMVRVGGGWADLGEYLREYAGHHGRRSVSDGKFEVRGLPLGLRDSGVTTLAGYGSGSGRTTPTSGYGSRPSSPTTTGRSGSALNVRKSRLVIGDLRGPDQNPSTPNMPTRSYDVTPGSGDSSPFTPYTRYSRQPSQSTDETPPPPIPLGLAGPTGKKTEISPGKKAWVDGMLDQARRASAGGSSSAEKARSGGGDFGDLGKVGGARRVFLRD